MAERERRRETEREREREIEREREKERRERDSGRRDLRHFLLLTWMGSEETFQKSVHIAHQLYAAVTHTN